MAKKQYFLGIDTETTMQNTVADFGAIVTDRKGNILAQAAILVQGHYGTYDLFHNEETGELWKRANLKGRMGHYQNMVDEGSRMIASVAAVNRWLEKALATYQPYLYAYNLPFDVDKCEKTAIDLSGFGKRFCLWAASADVWANTKKYKNFVMEHHCLNNVTKLGNATYKANAETMARFVLNNPEMPDEPHTAIEDLVDYELPILNRVLARRKASDLVSLTKPDWRKMQLKDHFTAK